MQALIDVILPVFLVIGFGYVTVWRKLFLDVHIDGLMKFAQNFAFPCLLFAAISRLDLSETFDFALLSSFYTGSATGFAAGLLGARYLFGRDWEDAVAIGFCCLFANSLMLGISITERAYGPDALATNYAIVALHSPFCYGIGITAMEIVRARGKSSLQTARTVVFAMFRNALVLGIALGFLVNFSGFHVPTTAYVALDLIGRAGLPVALFGMGGVLFRYRPEGDFKVIAYVCIISLVLHPSITWTLGTLNGLKPEAFRSAVLTASMAPGINAYVFANMYGRARRVAASSVLIATAVSILTIWLWLGALP